MTTHDDTGGGDRNEVCLEGRLSVPADVKELPSGGVLVVLKVVARRPDGSRSDSLPVVVGPAPERGRRRRPGQASAATVKRAASLNTDDRVRIAGVLQRHFWSAGGAKLSRLQVSAETVDRA